MLTLKKLTHPASTGITLSIALLGTASAMPAMADSFFDASAVVDLDLISISSSGSLDGLVIEGFDEVFTYVDPGAHAEGAVNFFDDPLGLGRGFDMNVAAFADGEATASASSLEAETDSFGSVTIVNGSGSEVEISFSLDYSLDTLAEQMAPVVASDDAVAEAAVDLSVNGIETVSEIIFADLLSGPTSDVTDGFSDFTLTLAPGEETLVDVSASAFGFAETAQVPVPVPAALPLFVSALLGLAGLGYNRRQNQ